jgi:hypothetical protein
MADFFGAEQARTYERRMLEQKQAAVQRNGWHPDAGADLRPIVPTSTTTAKDESYRGAGAASILTALNRAG